MMRPRHACLIVAAAAAPASAHTVWLVPEPGGWHMLFGGHAGKLEGYDPAKLKSADGIDAAGRRQPLQRRVASDGVHLSAKTPPALIVAHFDNGIHSRRPNGPSVERPMNEVPNATAATHAVKFHKTIVAWGTPQVTKPTGQRFELVPLSAAAPAAGRPMRLRVLIAGKPAAGIKVARNEEGQDSITDASGIATFVPERGFNKVWSGKRTPVAGNPAFTEDSVEYSLGFIAR